MNDEKLNSKTRMRHRRNMSKKTDLVLNKWEFSKLLFFIAFIWTSIVTIFSMIMMVITLDTSPLEILIGSAFAELATATGFYYSKAKAENRIKLRQKYGADVYNDSGASDA